jgi:chromosome segregation ATPase
MVQQLVNLRKAIEGSGSLQGPRSLSPSTTLSTNRAFKPPSPTAGADNQLSDLRAQASDREKQLSRALLNVQQLSNLIKTRDRRITALQMQLAAATAASAMAAAAMNGDVPPGFSPRASRTASPSALTEATAAAAAAAEAYRADPVNDHLHDQQQDPDLQLQLHDVEAMLQASEAKYIQTADSLGQQLADVETQRDRLQQQVVARQQDIKLLQQQVSLGQPSHEVCRGQ